MKPVAVPKLMLSFSVDLEVEYNSFDGKTTEEIADALQDDLHELLFELSPNVKGVFTSYKTVEIDD